MKALQTPTIIKVNIITHRSQIKNITNHDELENKICYKLPEFGSYPSFST